MPYISQVHIDQALTNVSLAYVQERMVGDRVLPSAPVDKRSDRWFIYGKELFNIADDVVRPGSDAVEVTYSLTTASYNADRHALRHLVTEAEKRVSDNPLRPEIDSAEQLTARVQTQRELKQLQFVTNPVNVTQNLALSGTSQWSDYTNSTPLVNIRTAKTTVRGGIAKEPNFLTIAYDGAMVLADHPSIKDLLKYTHEDALTSSGLPPIVRGLMVNEAGALYNTANPGQATNFGVIFGKNALIHYTTPSVGLKIVTFGYTFDAPDDITGVRGYQTRKWWDDGKAGTWVESAVTYDIQLLAPLGGYLLTSIY